MPQRLAQHLISKKLLAAHLVDEGLKRMQKQGGSLDTVLLEMQVISEPGMLQAISDVSGVRLVNLADFEPNAEAASMMPLKMSKQLGCVPLSLDGNALHLACSYPIPAGNLKDAGFLLGRQLELWVALEARIRDWQHVLYQVPLDKRYLKLLAQLDPSRPRVKDEETSSPSLMVGDSVSDEVKALAKRGVVQEPILLSSPKPAGAPEKPKPQTGRVKALEVVPVEQEESSTNVVDVTAYGRFARSASAAPDISSAFEESETRVLDVSGYANLAKELTREQQHAAADTTLSGAPVAGLFPGGVMPPRPAQASTPNIAPAIAPLVAPLTTPTSPSGTHKMPAFSTQPVVAPPPAPSDNVIVSPSILETTQNITLSPAMAAVIHREQLTAAAGRTQDDDTRYTELEKQVEAITRPAGTQAVALPTAAPSEGYTETRTPNPFQSPAGPAFLDARKAEEEAERTATWLQMKPRQAPVPPPPEDPEKTSAYLSMRPKGTPVMPLPAYNPAGVLPSAVPPPPEDPEKTSATLSMRPTVGPAAPSAALPEEDFSNLDAPVEQPLIVASLDPRPSEPTVAPVPSAAVSAVAEDDFSDVAATPPPPPPTRLTAEVVNLEHVSENEWGATALQTPAEEIELDDADNVLIQAESPAPQVPPEPEQVVPQPSPRHRQRPSAEAAAPTPSQPAILPAPPGLASSSAMEWTLAQARASLQTATHDRDALISVVLEYGRRTFDFVSAFAVLRGAAWGWDMRGDGELELVRSVGIPLDVSSMFRTVALTRGSYVGPPPNDPNTQHYLAAMGRAPRTAFVWPIEVQSRLVALVYGDCGSRPVSQRRLSDFILFCQELPTAFHDLILVRKNALAEAKSTHHTPVPTMAEAGVSESEDGSLDSSTFNELYKLLTGPDANERNTAMVELMRTPVASAQRLGFTFPGPTAWSRLPVEQLPEADELGPVPGALARLGQAGALALAPLLLSPEADTRYLALLTAGSLPWPEVVDGVVRGLFDEEPDISSAARAAATALKHEPRFQQALLGIRAELLADDPVRRSLAARALGVLHDRMSIEPLAARVDDEDPMSSGAAIDALKEITRFDAGANRGEWLRWWRQAQQKRRIEWVVEALASAEFECRLAAIEELSRTFGDTWGYSPEASEAERLGAMEAWSQFVAERTDLEL